MARTRGVHTPGRGIVGGLAAADGLVVGSALPVRSLGGAIGRKGDHG